MSSESPRSSDTLYKPNYHNGIYMNKNDFIKKQPSSLKSVTLKGLHNKAIDNIIDNGYFYDTDSNKKIKNVFAISYQGHLYFQINAILNNRNKYDRAQSNNFQNSFVRVILGGENYFYNEAELVNQWAARMAVNFGVVGGILANDLIKGKRIVWDFTNEELTFSNPVKITTNLSQTKPTMIFRNAKIINQI